MQKEKKKLGVLKDGCDVNMDKKSQHANVVGNWEFAMPQPLDR